MYWAFRTLGMFTFLSILLMAVGALLSYVFAFRIVSGIIIMLCLSVLLSLYSLFFSKKMALKANHARIIEEHENPRLYRIVRDVSERAGLPMPEVGIVESGTPNAFATGRNPKNAAVCATTGLLNTLSDNQLRGVIAHEIAHVRNRDILVMSVASAIASMVTYLAHVAYWAAIFAAPRDNNNSIGRIATALIMYLLLPIAALLIQLGVSRNREFLADRSGAEIIQDPRSLAEALAKIEGIDYKYSSRYDNIYDERYDDPLSQGGDNIYDCAHMWISNPLKKNGMSRLFSTHPPMEERIQRLNKLAEKMGL